MSENNSSPPPLPPVIPPPQPADLRFRILAFILDTVLIIMLLMMVLSTYIIPKYYPEVLTEMRGLLEALVEAAENNQDAETVIENFQPSEAFQDYISFTLSYLVGGMWLYYALNEFFTKGSSLGKKVFRLHIVSRRFHGSPNFFETLSRSGFKAMSVFGILTLPSIFALSPMPLLAINFAVPFFRKDRRSLHDMLSHTQVVEPTPPQLLNEIV